MISMLKKLLNSSRKTARTPASEPENRPTFTRRASRATVAHLLPPEDHPLLEIVFDNEENYRRFTMRCRSVRDEIQSQIILARTNAADLDDDGALEEFAKRVADAMTTTEREVALYTTYEFVGRQREALNRESRTPG